MIQDMKLTGDRKAGGFQPLDSLHYLGWTYIASPVIVKVDNQDATVRLTGVMEFFESCPRHG